MAKNNPEIGTLKTYVSKKTGKTSYKYTIYFKDKNGKVHRPTTKAAPKKRDAQTRAQHLLSDLQANDGKDTRTTVGDALQEHLPRASKHRSTATTYSLNKLLRIDHLVKIPLAELKPADLINYMDYAMDQEVSNVHGTTAQFKALPEEDRKVKPGTVRRDMVALKKAVKEKCFRASLPYPWAGIILDMPKPRGREFLITDEHVETLRLTAGYEYGDTPSGSLQYAFLMFIFSIETGMRAGEVAMLRNELIVENGLIAHLPPMKTKNEDARDVSLNTRAREILSWLPARADGVPLFKLTATYASQRFGVLRNKAGYPSSLYGGFRFHDSRHAYCTDMVLNGMQQSMLMELMGHRDPRMTVRYTNTSRDNKVRVMREHEKKKAALEKAYRIADEATRAAIEQARDAQYNDKRDMIVTLAE